MSVAQFYAENLFIYRLGPCLEDYTFILGRKGAP